MHRHKGNAIPAGSFVGYLFPYITTGYRKNTEIYSGNFMLPPGGRDRNVLHVCTTTFLLVCNGIQSLFKSESFTLVLMVRTNLPPSSTFYQHFRRFEYFWCCYVNSYLKNITLVSRKRHPFYFCENLAKSYPISIIFGSSRPEEIGNKNMHVYPPHLFTVLIPYLVKIMIYLRVFALF